MSIYDPTRYTFEPWEKEEEEDYLRTNLYFEMFVDDHIEIFDTCNGYFYEYYGKIIEDYTKKYKDFKSPAGIFLEKQTIEYIENKNKKGIQTRPITLHSNNRLFADLNRLVKKEEISMEILLQRICTMHTLQLKFKTK